MGRINMVAGIHSSGTTGKGSSREKKEALSEVGKSLDILVRAVLYQEKYQQYAKEAADYLREKLGDFKPKFAVVLGSGLGDLAEQIENPIVMDYADVPHFPRPTIEGHAGKFLAGTIEGVPVICMQGRKHYYEGVDKPMNTGILEAVFPVQVLAELGVPNFFPTNAVGGLDPSFKAGDVMAVRTHISLIPDPLLGRHYKFKRVDDGKEAWRFVPLHDAYDKELTDMLVEAGKPFPGKMHEGTYVAATGPSYETPGQVLMYRGWGGNAVGMSTAPEVTVARSRGMRAVAMSCISNETKEDGSNPANHEEVTANLNKPETRQRLADIMKGFFRLYRERQMAN